MRTGYGTRAPRAEEAAQVAALVHEAERSQDPTAGARTPAEFRAVWSRLDLARDALVATAPDGSLAGYAQVDVVRPGRLHADGYTRPGHLGAGIGGALIDWSGERARELAATAPHAGAPATLLHYVMLDGAADRMLRARGYRLARVHQRMRRSLAGPLPEPVWPEGVTVRACDGSPEELRRVHACAEEAFADRHEGAGRTFERWSADLLHEATDPFLWVLAERAGRIVGVAVCDLTTVQDAPSGEVCQLAVAREARRTGLGKALLLAAFARFAARSVTTVGLDVDSESPTGAHHLYARAGMEVTATIGQFEETLPAA
ncbi:GNAT family N-acetyltransferase [Streptomyces sp. NPDC058374]|uniref:GNAT family N-acetyltransferase n=1 Tax=Streptomyces sp. NPDC058374 TaxID=3346466 RepID=UPI00364F4C0C